MTARSEAVILCEGYDDRSFWAGWFKHLGCRDMSDGGKNKSIVDPWGKKVVGGQFGFESRSGGFIRVIPCQGDSGVTARIKGQLQQRTTQAVRALIVSLDADADDSSSREQSFQEHVLQADAAAKASGGRDLALADGTQVHLVLWEAACADPVLPAKQTLERLVCTAIHVAYPSRAPHISEWLAQRPPQSAPPALTRSVEPKAHAWSHVAGWYADKGIDAFYRCLWDDPLIAKALRERLDRSGAWAVAESIAL